MMKTVSFTIRTLDHTAASSNDFLSDNNTAQWRLTARQLDSQFFRGLFSTVCSPFLYARIEWKEEKNYFICWQTAWATVFYELQHTWKQASSQTNPPVKFRKWKIEHQPPPVRKRYENPFHPTSTAIKTSKYPAIFPHHVPNNKKRKLQVESRKASFIYRQT